MSLERLRNVVTGEVRDVQTNSVEYVDLINEIYDHQGSARPKWEITGQHQVMRIDDGEIDETDHGYAYKPIPGAQVEFDELGPEPHPERALTPGEVDSGITSHEDKMKGMPLTLVDGHLRNAERMEEVPVEERAERGRESAGSSEGKQRRSNGRGKPSGNTESGNTEGDSGSGSSRQTRSPGQQGQAAGQSSGGSNS